MAHTWRKYSRYVMFVIEFLKLIWSSSNHSVQFTEIYFQVVYYKFIFHLLAASAVARAWEREQVVAGRVLQRALELRADPHPPSERNMIQ